MKTSPGSLGVAIIAGAVAFAAVSATAQEPRTFRNTEGKTFEGELVVVKDGMAEIKRHPDGAIFTVPVTVLSLEDRKYLLDWMQREKAKAGDGGGLPEGWGHLEIRTPFAMDTVYSSGLSLGMSRTGGNRHEGDLLVGSWITVSTRRNFFSDFDLAEVFLKFEGNAEWHLEFREGRLYRAFQAGDRGEVVAAVVPEKEEDPQLFVKQLNSKPVAERVSFRILDQAGFDALPFFEHPIAGLSLGSDVSWESSIADLAPQAISVYTDDAGLRKLSQVPSLEHLILHETESLWSLDAFRELKKLPNLASLSLIPRDRLSPEFFEGFDRLRILYLAGRGKDRSPMALPPLPSLEALSISRLLSVEPKSLAGFPKLRYVSADGVGPAFRPSARMVMAFWGSGGADYSAPVADGLYSGLRFLNTEAHVDYSQLPNLQYLRVIGITPDMEKLEKVPKLRHLHLYEVQQSDLEALARIPNLEGLESIRLFRGKITSLAPLKKFTQLRSIRLDRLSEVPTEIDLTDFPRVRHFNVFDIYGLELIDGVASHPNLTFLELVKCNDLKSLGESAPNDTLDSVFITGAAGLKNLDVFKETTGLKALHIWGCKGMIGPMTLYDTNELEYLRVSDSGDFRDHPRQ